MRLCSLRLYTPRLYWALGIRTTWRRLSLRLHVNHRHFKEPNKHEHLMNCLVILFSQPGYGDKDIGPVPLSFVAWPRRSSVLIRYPQSSPQDQERPSDWYCTWSHSCSLQVLCTSIYLCPFCVYVINVLNYFIFFRYLFTGGGLFPHTTQIRKILFYANKWHIFDSIKTFSEYKRLFWA